jgi:hypothetical protein
MGSPVKIPRKYQESDHPRFGTQKDVEEEEK